MVIPIAQGVGQTVGVDSNSNKEKTMELTGILKVGDYAILIGAARQVTEARETRINIYRELWECGIIEFEMFQQLVNKIEIVNLKPSPVRSKD